MEFGKIFYPVTISVLLAIIGFLAFYNLSEYDRGGFTELYFLNDLPEEIRTNKLHNFSFAVHNLENKHMDYEYLVSVQSKEMQRGKVSLNHDETVILNSKFSIEFEEGNVPISVQLLNKKQEIHFWVSLK